MCNDENIHLINLLRIQPAPNKHYLLEKYSSLDRAMGTGTSGTKCATF